MATAFINRFLENCMDFGHYRLAAVGPTHTKIAHEGSSDCLTASTGTTTRVSREQPDEHGPVCVIPQGTGTSTAVRAEADDQDPRRPLLRAIPQ